MGTDKAKLVLEGETLLERIAQVLSEIASSVTVVGRKTDLPEVQSKPDVYPNWGALGGVHAALTGCDTEWAIVVACDMPYINPHLLNRLATYRVDYDAVAPLQADQRAQPLCALYKVEPCLEIAEKLIEQGERRPVTLLQSVRTRWVNFQELSDLPSAERFFENLNTPEDYLRVQSKGAVLHEID
jgi:molybdopterin-guanine dinucleotide biosynthesis protein A